MLAYNISQLLPEPLDTCFFSVSGAEAVEAGIKLITRVQPDYKTFFITFREDYHGKTHGALSFTDSENFGSGFHVGIPRENVIFLAPGDIQSLKSTIKMKTIDGYKNSIAGIIMEPIQGQTLGILPKGYLKEAIRAWEIVEDGDCDASLVWNGGQKSAVQDGEYSSTPWSQIYFINKGRAGWGGDNHDYDDPYQYTAYSEPRNKEGIVDLQKYLD